MNHNVFIIDRICIQSNMIVLGQAESRARLNDAVFLVLIDDGDLTENGIAFVDVVNTVDGLRLADRVSLLPQH